MTDDSCADTEMYTFNVHPSKYDGHSSCAVLAPGPTPAANPCGAKVDAAAAPSISAAITAWKCAGLHPVVSCPPAATTASGGAARPLASIAAWGMSTFGWLAFFLL